MRGVVDCHEPCVGQTDRPVSSSAIRGTPILPAMDHEHWRLHASKTRLGELQPLHGGKDVLRKRLHEVDLVRKIARLPSETIGICRVNDVKRPQRRPEPATEGNGVQGWSLLLQLTQSRKDGSES